MDLRGRPRRGEPDFERGRARFDPGVLEEIDYHGWLTLEREGGDSRVADVAGGVAFLRRLVGGPEEGS